MAKKRLKIKDKQGNVVDYDISAASVTIDVEGKSLEVKLSELVDAISRSVKSVTFNGNSPTMDSNGNVNLGQQMQGDWTEANINWPSYIKNKPSFSRVATTGSYNDLTDKPTIPEGVATDSQMSDSSDAPVKNRVIKAYVDNLISGLINGAPQALDTLKELSAALGNDANFAATITNQLANKANSADVYTKSQTYSKGEVDAKVADAGKVKSVTINGTKKTPNETTGDVDLGTIVGQQGPKGDTGNVEITDAGDLVTILVNDLTTGGAGNILSAEMGKRLALMSGTFAQAWARSKAIPFPFCFLWNETIGGDAISKPIWHKGNSVFVDAAGAIVNVEAASVPDAPTITGATSGDTVPKNTQITITHASGSALYYSLDGGTTYNVSDAAVTIVLTTAGSVSIVAYCANNKGNSSNATLSVTVAGTPVPVFSPSQGEVERGGYVTISVPSAGELHYKVGSGSWQTASGTSASVQITGNTTIQAYNIQDGDTSNTVTGEFTMAALAAPSMTMSDTTETQNEFPAGGGTVSLSAATGATIYYTTDGSTPTDQNTQYTGVIAVTSTMTIKAIAIDAYGSSEVSTNTYTVAVAKIVVVTDAATTMSLGDTGLTAIPLVSGTNEFTIDDINELASTSYTSFADHKFNSLSFTDKLNIIKFDGGGVQIKSLKNSFDGVRNVEEIKGIIVSDSCRSAFEGAGYNKSSVNGLCKLSGTTSILKSCFMNAKVLKEIDLSGLDTSTSTSDTTAFTGVFNGCSVEKLTIGNFTNVNAQSGGMGSYKTMWDGCGITDLYCTTQTPPAVHATDEYNIWKLLASKREKNVTIHVPAGTLSAYKAAWGIDTEVNWVEEQ